jgi:hypothetical protein
MFDASLNKRAKTALPGFGDPIIGIGAWWWWWWWWWWWLLLLLSYRDACRDSLSGFTTTSHPT